MQKIHPLVIAKPLILSERERRLATTLIGLAVLFLVIALVAYVLGAKGVAGFSMSIAKILIVVFLVLFVLSFFFGIVMNV